MIGKGATHCLRCCYKCSKVAIKNGNSRVNTKMETPQGLSPPIYPLWHIPCSHQRGLFLEFCHHLKPWGWWQGKDLLGCGTMNLEPAAGRPEGSLLSVWFLEGFKDLSVFKEGGTP